MKSFTNIIRNRLDYIDVLNEAQIGLEFEFYSKMSYYKTLESLNAYLSPVKVHGFRSYHSKFKVTKKNWKLEPDYSGGPNMCELITAPIRYTESRIYLSKVLKWMQDYSNTDDRCAIHVNVGFPDKSDIKVENLNILKLLLNIDEHKILKEFPDRKYNIYSKSVANIIPFRKYDFSDTAPSIIASNIHLPDTKYYGVNLEHIIEGRVEWRYLGGQDYQFKIGQILDALDYFVLLTNDSLVNRFDNDDFELLREYLEQNIYNYKSLSEIDDFISMYPTIELQVDKLSLYENLNAYYHKFYDKLYDLIMNTENLQDCIVNWDATRNRMEVVNAKVRSNTVLAGYDFVSCDIDRSSVSDSVFYECIVNDSTIDTSVFKLTDIKDSKIIESHVDEKSVMYDSFFMAGVLEGEMKGGILRSGQLGKHARLSSQTRILTDDNFFNVKKADISKKGKGKVTKLKS